MADTQINQINWPQEIDAKKILKPKNFPFYDVYIAKTNILDSVSQ